MSTSCRVVQIRYIILLYVMVLIKSMPLILENGESVDGMVNDEMEDEANSSEEETEDTR